MTQTRTCAECGTSLPEGVADVFCPACAFRRALTVNNALVPQESKAVSSFGWLSRFKTINRLRKGRQKGLDSTPNPGGESPRVTTAAPEPGEVFEDYEILDKIGGNMGLVFRARHRLLDNIVALKFFPADYITDPGRLARFQRELRAMGQLKHPNLVTAADARIVGCWHLVAMEFIEGVDLQRLVQLQGRLQLAPACEIARQAALGLQYAHEHGLIHRDIKPSNLMLTQAGTIKVIDMGLALRKEETQLTQEGSVLGTMSYCAPEQVRAASQVDIRADIYSLGCTLYHLLVGKPPYSHRTTFTELAHAHIHEPFPNLTTARPDAPAQLEAVLARMTAKEPDARFATPQEVAAALEPFARGTDLKKLVPAEIVRPAGGRTSPTPGRRTAEPAPKTPWAAVAAVLAVLLAISGAVFLFESLTRHDPVVVLMDTTAPGGIYDPENQRPGGSNTKELQRVLTEDNFLPSSSLHPEPVFEKWNREAFVISLRPDLMIIHRSSFYHPVNAVLNLGRPPFTNAVALEHWKAVYELADEKLILFMAYVASHVPRAKFLIYSRGTDPEWVRDEGRLDWQRRGETHFPELKGRVFPMLIEGGYDKGTFKNEKIAEDLRNRVKIILGLPDKRQPDKRESAGTTNTQKR